MKPLVVGKHETRQSTGDYAYLSMICGTCASGFPVRLVVDMEVAGYNRINCQHTTGLKKFAL